MVLSLTKLISSIAIKNKLRSVSLGGSVGVGVAYSILQMGHFCKSLDQFQPMIELKFHLCNN